MRVLGLFWGFLVDLGVTQAQTHTFPSEISRLSRLRKMSLYLFLLSGAGSSPGGGECHTKPPSTLSTLAGSLEGGETERGERYRQKVLTLWEVWDGMEGPGLGWGRLRTTHCRRETATNAWTQKKSNKTDAPDAATLSLGEESRLDNETTRISGQTDGNNTWDRQARELWQKHT